MDPWMNSEARYRREELYAHAQRVRRIRLSESGRSRSIRGRLALGAEALSELLAGLASRLREPG
jgi:hypothetical protein